jgi:hypothetical protein
METKMFETTNQDRYLKLLCEKLLWLYRIFMDFSPPMAKRLAPTETCP